MTLDAQLEALLFLSSHSMSLAKLAEMTSASADEVRAAVERLVERYHGEGSGLRLVRHAQSVQLATAPELSKLVTALLKDEQRSELTKPALETLTIILYRGPMTKAELDTIRGVNCSLILRNLLIKGLIETADGGGALAHYQVTFDFLRFLGVERVNDLPDYDKLHTDDHIDKLLNPSVPTDGNADAGEPETVDQSESMPPAQ
jgi:segregation and condensation protein B